MHLIKNHLEVLPLHQIQLYILFHPYGVLFHFMMFWYKNFIPTGLNQWYFMQTNFTIVKNMV